MTILVTAFEPFGESKRNASLDTLLSLPDRLGECRIETCILPVVFDDCAEILRERIAALSPAAVVCLGQAEGRGPITPEYVAVNCKHTASTDNAGRTYHLQAVIEDGPDAYFTTLPVDRIVTNLKNAGIPAALSFTAGTYVCNDLFYHAVHLCKPLGIPAGFIHLPLSYEIAAEEGKVGRVLTMPQSAITAGILSALGVIYAECLQTNRNP